MTYFFSPDSHTPPDELSNFSLLKPNARQEVARQLSCGATFGGFGQPDVFARRSFSGATCDGLEQSKFARQSSCGAAIGGGFSAPSSGLVGGEAGWAGWEGGARV